MNFQIIFAYYCMIYDSVCTGENQVTGFYMKCNRELNGSNNLQIWQKFKSLKKKQYCFRWHVIIWKRKIRWMEDQTFDRDQDFFQPEFYFLLDHDISNTSWIGHG